MSVPYVIHDAEGYAGARHGVANTVAEAMECAIEWAVRSMEEHAYHCLPELRREVLNGTFRIGRGEQSNLAYFDAGVWKFCEWEELCRLALPRAEQRYPYIPPRPEKKKRTLRRARGQGN